MVERSLSMREVLGIDTPHLQTYNFTNSCRFFIGTVELYRLRQKILKQRIQKKQGNLITQFCQPHLMGMYLKW